MTLTNLHTCIAPWLLAGVILLLSACGGGTTKKGPTLSPDQQLAQTYGYSTNIEPVKRILDYRSSSFESINDRSLVIRGGGPGHYLITLRSPCSGLSLVDRFNTTATVNQLTLLDAIVVQQAYRGGPQNCAIDAMYRIHRPHSSIGNSASDMGVGVGL